MLKKRVLPIAATLLLLAAFTLVAVKGTAATSSPFSSYRPPQHTGGTITYGDFQFPSSTNPWFNTLTVGQEVQDALWANPITTSSEGTYVPDQLVEVPTVDNGDVSKDGLTVVMKLRPDLTWSDGQPITADDFVYWQQTNLDPNTGAAFTFGFDQIASITAADTHTVVLTYAHSFGAYLAYLPLAAPRHAWGSIPDSQLASTQTVNLAPQVNSGPFIISAFAPGQSFTMVPNPHYTSSTFHKSVLDQLIFQKYPSKAALIAAYQAGQIQHAEGFNPNDLLNQSLNGLPGLHLAPQIALEYLTFNLLTPVLQDVNVRQAITQAIDRCQIIQQVLHQSCQTLQIQGFLPKPSPAFDPTITLPAFNLSQAKQDMQASGWDCSSNPCTKNSQPFPTLTYVTTANNTFRLNTFQLIQQDLAALGIPVTLQTYPASILFSDFNHNGPLATGQYDIGAFAQVFGLDPDGDLYPIFPSSQIPNAQNPGGGNDGRVNDPNLDALLNQGRTTLDQPTRMQLYRNAQHLIANQLYVLPLFLFPNITLTSARVVNYADNGTGVGNEWNAGDWWLAPRG